MRKSSSSRHTQQMRCPMRAGSASRMRAGCSASARAVSAKFRCTQSRAISVVRQLAHSATSAPSGSPPSLREIAKVWATCSSLERRGYSYRARIQPLHALRTHDLQTHTLSVAPTAHSQHLSVVSCRKLWALANHVAALPLLRRARLHLRALRRRPVRPFALLSHLTTLTAALRARPEQLWLTYTLVLCCGSSPRGSGCGPGRPGCGWPRHDGHDGLVDGWLDGGLRHRARNCKDHVRRQQ